MSSSTKNLILSERRKYLNRPASVLALTCPLTIQKTKRDAEIEIERPEQMVAFLDAEEKLIEEKIDATQTVRCESRVHLQRS